MDRRKSKKIRTNTQKIETTQINTGKIRNQHNTKVEQLLQGGAETLHGKEVTQASTAAAIMFKDINKHLATNYTFVNLLLAESDLNVSFKSITLRKKLPS